VDGALSALGEPQSFQVESLGLQTLKAADAKELLAFQRKTRGCSGPVLGAVETAEEAQGRLKVAKKAIDDTPAADPKLGAEARRIERELDELLVGLRGDRVMAGRNVPVPMSTVERVETIVGTQWSTTVARRAPAAGLRDCRRRVREAAGDPADAGRDGPAGPRGCDGEGRRTLDPGPRPDLDEGVAREAAGRSATGGPSRRPLP